MQSAGQRGGGQESHRGSERTLGGDEPCSPGQPEGECRQQQVPDCGDGHGPAIENERSPALPPCRRARRKTRGTHRRRRRNWMSATAAPSLECKADPAVGDGRAGQKAERIRCPLRRKSGSATAAMLARFSVRPRVAGTAEPSGCDRSSNRRERRPGGSGAALAERVCLGRPAIDSPFQ